MLLGDFNAKVCCDNKHKKRTMGRHGVDVITKNGETLVYLCQQNDLVTRRSTNLHGHHQTVGPRTRSTTSSSPTQGRYIVLNISCVAATVMKNIVRRRDF
ncbi:hypothetical protein DPMN_065415 [Dreissena polymorpha]|uniref:Uncharacterized protein n=1 Tax=Dreissena polymorpha TaxID=45954 RepID=A0A9D4BJL3_DREPO|nr:hypothetical protein DPMN_065415 [Dreissena polymorpha]